MKLREVKATIPVALQELHDQGIERAYVDQIGEQVTLHDDKYLARRDTVRNFLRRVNIDLPELPSGHMRPGVFKMYTSLGELEEAGVIAGDFEEPRDDGKPSRRQYFLVNQTSFEDQQVND